MSNTILIGMICILLLFVFVGNYAGKKVHNIEDYYVSGRNANTLLITGTIVASALSTNCFMGDAGFTYDGYFMINVFFVMMMGCGHVYGTLFYGRFIRRSEALTVADYFGKRFNSRRVQIVVAIVAIVACMSYLLSVTQGINLVLSQVTGINYKACLVITWAVYTSFVVYSGSRGVILTDTMMFILFFAVALCMIPFTVTGAVGEFSVAEVFRELADYGAKPGIASYVGITDGYMGSASDIIIWGILVGGAWGAAMMVSPWQAGRYLMAKNEHTVLRAGIWSSFLVFIVQSIIYFGAVCMVLVKEGIDPSESVFIWAAQNLFPTILGVALLSGIVSAGLSSASTFLSVIGFSVVKDIMGRDDHSKEGLKFNRIVMLVAGLIVLGIAFFMPLNIYWITIFAGTTIAGSLTIASLFSVWKKNYSETAAFWTVTVGLVVTCAMKLMKNAGMITLPVWLDTFFIGFLASLVIALILSAVTKPREADQLFRQKLHVIPQEEKDPVVMKKTIRHGYYLITAGVVIALFLIFAWALPYNGII